MATLARLGIIITADDQASKALGGVADRLKGLGTAARNAGLAISAGITAPVTLLGRAAAGAALDFETTFGEIEALVGVPADELARLRQQVLDLAPAVGIGPGELANALYFVTSAGIPASKALSVVEASAKAAASGLGDTAMVADVATSAMNAYAQTGLEANDAVSVLVATVREGKAEPAELAASLGMVIPTAASLGVSFDQVGAAMAAMTRSGLGAAEAGTSLNAILNTLLSPSAEAEKTLNQFGLSAAGLRQQLGEQGLLPVLRTLEGVFGDNEEAMAAVFGNVRALRGVFNLTGQEAETVNGIFQRLAESSGDLDKAFAITAQGAPFKLQQALARIKVALVEIGAAIVPVVVPAIGQLARAVAFLANAFSQLPGPVKTAIVIAIGLVAALGPVLAIFGQLAISISALISFLPALTAALGAAGAAIGAVALPVLLVVGALALLAVAYKRNWLGFGDAVRAVAGWIADMIGRVVHWFRVLIHAVDLVQGGSSSASRALGHFPRPLQLVIRVVRKAVRWIRLLKEAFSLAGDNTVRMRKILHVLPAPLARVAIAFSRVVSMVQRFIRAWQQRGPAAAFRQLSHDLEKLGRTLGNLLASIGLERLGAHVKALFRDLGQVVRDAVKLVDDLVHGRWAAAWRDLQRLARDALDLFLTWLQGAPAVLRDLFDLALDAIRAVDWGGVASWLLGQGGRLLRALYDGAVGFVTGTLIPWLGGLLPSVPGWIGDAAGWLVDTGKSLLGGLWDGITGVWDSKLKPFFGNLPAKIAGLFPADFATRLLGTGSKILGGLWNGIKDVWDNTVKPFFSGIISRVVGAMPALMDLAGPLINAGKSVLNGIWNGITAIWDGAGGLREWFGDIVNKIFAAIPGFDEMLRVLKPVGENLLGAIKAGIDEAWGEIVGVFSTIADKVGDVLGKLALVRNALDKIKKLAGEVWDKITDIADWVGGLLGDGGGGGQQAEPVTLTVAAFDGGETLGQIQAWVSSVEGEFARISQWLIPPQKEGGAVGGVQMMHPVPFDGQSTLEAIATWVTSVTGQFDSLRTSVETAMQNVAMNVDLGFALAASSAKTQLDTLSTGVSIRLDTLKTTVSTKAADIASALDTGLRGMRNIGNTRSYEFATAFQGGLEDLAQPGGDLSVPRVAGQIASALSTALSGLGSTGYSLGYEFGRGLNNGIAAWTSAIAWTAWNAVNQAVNAAKQAAGIASPSRVMAGLGEDLMAGLTLGITRGSAEAAHAMAGAIGAVVSLDGRAPVAAPVHYDVEITVSGAGDPQAVASAVLAEFSRRVRMRAG